MKGNLLFEDHIQRAKALLPNHNQLSFQCWHRLKNCKLVSFSCHCITDEGIFWHYELSQNPYKPIVTTNAE